MYFKLCISQNVPYCRFYLQDHLKCKEEIRLIDKKRKLKKILLLSHEIKKKIAITVIWYFERLKGCESVIKTATSVWKKNTGP